MRGYAIIFNHKTFTIDKKERLGTEHDVLALKNVFEKFNIYYKVHKDFTFCEITTEVERLKKFDFKDYSYLAIIILTHGDIDNIICAKDQPYNLNLNLVEPIVNQNRTLNDKPKIFIIQACKGKNSHPFFPENFDASGSSPKITIPTKSNMCFVYSTFEGYVSARNPEFGAPFIQSLCKHIDKYGTRDTIEVIMRRVTKDLTENIYQVPMVISTLAEEFYFCEKPVLEFVYEPMYEPVHEPVARSTVKQNIKNNIVKIMSSARNPNQRTSNQKIKEDLIELSRVFITYYTEKCEEKLKAYHKELDPGEETKATKKIKNFADAASNLPVPFLENIIEALEIVLPISSIRRETVYEKNLLLNGKRELFVEAGGYIFWSYQNQFIHVTDIHDNVTVGMLKLAIDAVDQTFNFIENSKSENLNSGFINIAIGAFFGQSKTALKGETIIYKSSKCQTASLYEGVSIVKMDVDGNYVQYKKSNDEKFGYRLASSEEACDLSEYKMYDWEENATVKEILTINDMKPHLEEILNKINYNNPVYLQQTINKNTVELKQNLDIIKENTSKIDDIKTDTTEIKQNQIEIKNKTSNIKIDATAINTNRLALREDTTIIKDRLNRISKYTSLLVIPFFVVVIAIIVSLYSVKPDSTNILLDTSKKTDQLEKSSKNECYKDKGLQNICFPKQHPESMWFDIKEPVKSFTGRVEILKSLHKALQNNLNEQVVLSQTTVITGLGGIGKTELARKYIYDYKTNYNNVIWIKSETQQIFKESFHKVAKKLNLSIKENIKKEGREERERDLTSIIEDIYVYFQNTKTLIILDNVDKFEDIKQFLEVSLPPNIAKPFILITSRNQNWEVGDEGTIIILQLNEFTQKESRDFIKKSLLDDISTNEELTQLSDELQNFPLALRQATAYINMMQKQLKMQGKQIYGIGDYLSQYNDNKSKLLTFRPNVGFERYFDTVYTTWIVTLQKIEENNDATTIIQFMAYLKSDAIDVKLIFSKYFKDENDMWRAIELLHQYSMINIVNGVANIHRLVQQVIRVKLYDEKREEEILQNALVILRRPEKEQSIYEHNGFLWNFASFYKQIIFDNYFEYKYGGSWEDTPLHLLVLFGYVTAVENIINCFERQINTNNVENENVNMFDINELNGKNLTPLQEAVYGNQINMTILLISKGADIYVVDENGFTLLHFAVYYKYPVIVKYLLKNTQININVIDEFGMTLLYRAVFIGYINIVKLLIENKADFNIGNENGDTILHIAVDNGHTEIIKYLLNCNLIEIDTRDNNGNTPLHVAVLKDNIDITELLISQGADFNDVDNYGSTILHIAATFGKINVTKYILNSNLISVNVKDNGGNTPLQRAAKHGFIEIIEILISKGGNVNIVNKDGQNALHTAILNKNTDVVKYLSSSTSINIETKEKNGCKSFEIAYKKTMGDKYLLSSTSRNIKTKEKNGCRPLEIAVIRGDIEIVKLLFSEGADFNVVDENDFTILHHAVKYGYIDIIRYLLDSTQINRYAKDKNGYTPLHVAVVRGYIEIVKILTSNGDNFDVYKQYGNDLLHFARNVGHKDITNFILNLVLLNNDATDSTPLKLALTKDHDQILKHKEIDFIVKDNDLDEDNHEE